MDILGISAYYHDSAACLLRDGEIVAAAQEERFTRRKHDPDFPARAVQYCLREAGTTPEKLDLVAFYDKPFIKFERLLFTYLSYAPAGLPSFLMAMPLWLKQKLWLKEIIQKEVGYKGKIIFPEHHESHAAAAFFPSPYDEAAIITVDGVGEWTTASYGVGNGNRVRILSEIKFPHSLGLLYSAFTYHCGFKVNSGEYKLMGLAPYGEPKYEDVIRKNLIDIKDDGSFRLNLKYFGYMAGLRMTNDNFTKLFGVPPRKPETKLTQEYMDMARSIQVVTEDVMLKMARHVRKETGARNLVLSGGVALNCVANGKILKEGIFDDMWIQPAAGDAGGALGSACIAWHHYLDKPRAPLSGRDRQKATYLGPAFSGEEIENFLKERNAPYEIVEFVDVPDRVAALIASENVIGWFQGRMEFGPRALGARSIIGDPRSTEMQFNMNVKIKFRESFRPFAPSVLEERIGKYFDIACPSPYMLLVAQVRPEFLKPPSEEDKKKKELERLYIIRSEVPAITHIDNSARIQSVSRRDNPLYHDTIAAFEKLTGCGLIINTSFNVRGEPIVCSPEDAYRCFMRTNMDYLIMGKYLLDKKKQPMAEVKDDWQKEFPLD